MVEAAVEQPAREGKSRRGRVLASDELSSVFGVDIDMDEAPAAKVPASAKRGRRAVRTKKKISKGSAAARKLAARRSAAKKKAATRKTATKKKGKAATKRAPRKKTSSRSAGRTTKRTRSGKT
jgi:hypothetical protein